MDLRAAPGLNGGLIASHDDILHSAMMPPLRRTPMAPSGWPLRSAFSVPGKAVFRRDARPCFWHRAGTVRRSLLLALVLIQTVLATWSMTAVLPYHGSQPLEIALLALFVLLFAWISAGFWTAVMGFLVLLLASSPDYARPSGRSRPQASCATSISSCCRTQATPTVTSRRSRHGAMRATGSARPGASSIAGAFIA
jgi:membrane glycosyltransferase